jgi:hypothetical protein
MKRILLALAFPAVVHAQDHCVLQDRIVSRSQVVIAERSPIRRDVVPYFDNRRKCMVDFRVRIGPDWHTAFGEHVWEGHRPADEACAIAVARAEDAVRQRIGSSQTASERILVCKDQPALQPLRNVVVGTVGDLAQFRPHPDRLDRFWHNGAQCKWFVESAFLDQRVRQFQGIICEIQDAKWVVVDKF